MLRPLLNAAYWMQVQSLDERERQRFDTRLNAPPVEPVKGGPPPVPPGAQALLGLMRGGATRGR